METLITLSYVALCVIVFRVFKVPKNRWTLTTAVVIGAFLLGWIFLYMAMYQPVSRLARVVGVTTPITSEVRGLVTDVYIKGNEPLKKGDPLYLIDPTPFKAALDSTKADILKVDAEIKYAKTELARYQNLNKTDFASQESVDNITNQLDEALAQRASLLAQQQSDQFNLDSTVVRAPTDGYVSQMLLRPGMKSRSVPFQGNLTFVHDEDKIIFAAFKQSPARYLKVGYPAEITFATIPGHAYKAKVTQINDIFSQGSVSASGHLIDPLMLQQEGRILVRVEIDQPELLKGMPIPIGTDAHVAVYSPHWEMFSIIRKVILRMQSWHNWLFEG
ncbi:HlyD family secretion protein [Vibrio sp. SS-MA-C1-2]|uniref:HlyD family secretion protein n=1 Tax=Vibrio sp. SS-MA-C1-2 TaxID=2908646 RepID=UPI001F3879C7|nr:HlyD family secretion protein [Vibrio sp. SS-MA-C1-2]UJF17740.1 HlyD family secretion protein [Vibrio sp. SS-MA-C1-2]